MGSSPSREIERPIQVPQPQPGPIPLQLPPVFTSLYETCQIGDLSGTRRLLLAGEDPNTEDGVFGSILGRACATQNPDLVALLLEFKADPNLFRRPYFPPLSWAIHGIGKDVVVSESHWTILSMLLSAGADINQTGVRVNMDYGTVFHEAIQQKANSRVLEFLLDHKADVNSQTRDAKVRPLFLYLSHMKRDADLGVVQRFLDHGAPVVPALRSLRKWITKECRTLLMTRHLKLVAVSETLFPKPGSTSLFAQWGGSKTCDPQSLRLIFSYAHTPLPERGGEREREDAFVLEW